MTVEHSPLRPDDDSLLPFADPRGLTAREREVLAHLAAGRTNREIAERLTITPSTAERHVHNIFAKLGVSNRVQAAARAGVTLRLIDVERTAPDSDHHAELAFDNPPYPGLRPFTSEDSAMYFGRNEAIERVIARAGSCGQVTLVGSSGIGKSSLIRAGVIPALKAGALPGSSKWEYLFMSPGGDPLAELASRLAAIEQASAVALLHDLESDARTLDLLGRHGSDDSGEDFRLVLAVDQLEELFTMCREPNRRQQFLRLIAGAMAATPQRVIPILAIRADFLGELTNFPGLAELLEPGQLLLGPASAADLRAAIEGPASAAGLFLEPGLTERILADLGDAPGALPLLSHSLRETWAHRQSGTLTISGYLRSGGIRGAIAQTAERLFGSLTEPEQLALRRLMVRLTVLGEGTDATRRRVTYAELPDGPPASVDVRRLIGRLAEARLVTTGRESVEVAHEALIREWPRLREWLEDDLEGHKILRHLTEAAQSWDALGRDQGELYRGARLLAANEWANHNRQSLNALEQSFLDASQTLQDEDGLRNLARLRRLRLLVAGLALVVLIAAIGAGGALWQWQRANVQRDRAEQATREAESERDAAGKATLEATLARLETEIPSTLEKDRSLAFLLAREAYSLQPGPRTTGLMDAVLGDDPRWLGSIHLSESLLTQFSVSPDGKYIALATQSGLVELHDASTHSLMNSARSAPGLTQNSHLVFVGTNLLVHVVYGAADEASANVFSIPDLNLVRKITWDRSSENFGSVLPASAELAILRAPESGSCCQTFRIIDLHTGAERVAQLPPLNFPPNDFLFDGSGSYAAMYLADPGTPRIAILNARTFEVSAIVSPAGDTLRWYDLSQDGKILVTAYSFGIVQAWDTATGELLGTGNVNNFSPGQFTLSKSGRELVATTANLSLVRLSVPDFTPLGPPFFVGSSSGSFTLYGAEDDSFYSFDVPSNSINHWSLDGSGLANTHRVETGLGRSAFAPDGSWMVKQALDGSWTRWSLPDLHELDHSSQTFGPIANNKYSLTPIPPVVSGDGHFIITTNTDCPPGNQAGCAGRVVLWNAETGAPVGDPIPVANPAPGGPGIVLAAHPDLPILAIGGSVAPGSREVHIGLWSVSERGLARTTGFTVTTDKPTFNGMTFVPGADSADVKLVIWARDSFLTLWDVSGTTPKEIITRQFGRQSTLAIGSQEEIIVGDGDELKFFTGKQFALGDPAPPSSVLAGPLAPNLGISAQMSESDDGRNLAVSLNGGQAAGQVSIWDVEQGAAIGSSFNWLPSLSRGKSDEVFLAADASFLVTSSDAATVVWDLNVSLWAEKICEAAGRNLTEAEWTKYFPGREYETTCPQWPAKPNL